jgi:hypothetical protein
MPDAQPSTNAAKPLAMLALPRTSTMCTPSTTANAPVMTLMIVQTMVTARIRP